MDNLFAVPDVRDVHYVNFTVLLAIQASLRRDLTTGSYQFRLSREQADRLTAMSADSIGQLAANMGDECLFAPRDSFLRLLDVPPPLASMLAAVSAEPRRAGRPAPGER